MRARPIALLSSCFLLSLGCGEDPRPGADTDTGAQTTIDSGLTPGSDSDDATSAPTTGGGNSGTGTTGQDPTGMSSETSADITTADPPGTTTEEPTGTTGGGDPVPGALCEPIPKCDAAPPTIPGQGAPESDLSRGRDMFYVEGEQQWVLAKFTKWGFPADKDIEGGAVHLFLDRGCGGVWEELGVAITTVEGEHAPVQGVDDSGGRVYYKISQSDQLEPGRHRVHGVVEEFWNTVDIIIDVVPAGAPIFVSDVDGTLTTSENEEAWDFLLGDIPEANPFAAEALSLLASKGYRPMYLTARPEWLDRRTREFVALRGFPAGIIHTTLTYTGGMGDTAAAYKSGEFQLLKDKGLVPTWLFGNKDSDAEAFESTMIPTDHRVLFQFTDAVYGARRIDSYQELLAEFEALPDLCDR
ncbi:hypothetical protein OV090_39175 [Nannocystis sp. RBIL2]|uniref:LNS2 domain-containing protein n=1 Tax=Nannocystis sp. RBIL2 TaxID=2996788 RepID=UPI00226E8723|nr:hypothetical protein [Nannocystis sp. RBIL2]MCY1070830.1 hypothetical protein [Nannocystis sp. RBIL2]